MDIWYCIVESCQLDSHGFWGYRLIKAIPTTLQDTLTDKLRQEFYAMQVQNPRVQTMIFTRAPDESMFTHAETKGTI